MRLAILSDIHGNAVALDCALDDLRHRSVDKMVCLGDAVQGGPQPAETVARLRQLDWPVVMGNSDAWLLSGVDTDPADPVTDQQRAVREWSIAQLSRTDQDYIRTFQPIIQLDIGLGRSLVCFHGSPHSYDDVILPETAEAEFIGMLSPFEDSFCTGGHTHLQQVRRWGPAFFFNPGSVGSAFDRYRPTGNSDLDPWVEYALLTVDGAKLGLEFRRLPLDVDEYMRVLKASGRPQAELLAGSYGRSLD